MIVIIKFVFYMFISSKNDKIRPGETDGESVKEEVSSAEIDVGPSFRTFQ